MVCKLECKYPCSPSCIVDSLFASELSMLFANIAGTPQMALHRESEMVLELELAAKGLALVLAKATVLAQVTVMD